MRKTQDYDSGNLKGIVSLPENEASTLLILLHGVGGNEKGVIEVGEIVAPEGILVSLRAPLIIGTNAFAWFHVQFTASGPVHNWAEAEKSFELLEVEIHKLSHIFNIPLSGISVLGFSQGSIMTMGLALKSSLALSHYFCFSGRTLPEFAQSATIHPELVKGRRVFLAHGKEDEKLPVSYARASYEILQKAGAGAKYIEFSGGHSIEMSVLKEAGQWFKGANA
jgi:phospholipase/carboxylesterase